MIISKTRKFMADEKIDYLLVNSTNKFLVEYTDLCENSRYFLTKFSGSAGDALLSQKDLRLFVDGRYHQQADLEVDKNLVKVVKMKLGARLSNEICKNIKPDKTLGLVAQKVSQGQFEVLSSKLAEKNVKLKLLDRDPLEQAGCQKPSKIEVVDNLADEKFQKLVETLGDKVALLITNLEEVSYITGLRDFGVSYSSKIEAKLLVMKDFALLFIDKKVGNFSERFQVKKFDEFEEFIKNLSPSFAVYVDKNTINAYDYRLLGDKAYVVQESLVKSMKAVKSDSEIEHYKKSFARTDKALLAIRDFINDNEGLSEFDIDKKLDEEFFKHGAKSLSFRSIVAKDKNSALAHYSKSSKDEILKEGSIVLIDCGAYYELGLATDITRVFCKGKPSAQWRKVYTTVLKGFLHAFNAKISKGTSGFDLDSKARAVMDLSGFEFSHALGHGIGINVHEAPPNLGTSEIAKTPLKENMCFTIEPGLYKKGFGGVRLENSCYLKDGVINSFTKMPFEDKMIDYDMLNEEEKQWLKALQV